MKSPKEIRLAIYESEAFKYLESYNEDEDLKDIFFWIFDLPQLYKNKKKLLINQKRSINSLTLISKKLSILGNNKDLISYDKDIVSHIKQSNLKLYIAITNKKSQQIKLIPAIISSISDNILAFSKIKSIKTSMDPVSLKRYVIFSIHATLRKRPVRQFLNKKLTIGFVTELSNIILEQKVQRATVRKMLTRYRSTYKGFDCMPPKYYEKRKL